MLDRVHLKIKSLRIEKGYSQEYLAEQLKISQSYYAKIENGNKEISVKQLLQILKILEIDVDTFFNKLSQLK